MAWRSTKVSHNIHTGADVGRRERAALLAGHFTSFAEKAPRRAHVRRVEHGEAAEDAVDCRGHLLIIFPVGDGFGVPRLPITCVEIKI